MILYSLVLNYTNKKTIFVSLTLSRQGAPFHNILCVSWCVQGRVVQKKFHFTQKHFIFNTSVKKKPKCRHK